MTERTFPSGCFSVEWARVEPEEGTFSDEALMHYQAILDRCLELGLTPIVTFNHFTAPHWFAMRAGWLDPKAPELFARYCDRLMAAFGDKIGYAVTMNEPNLARLLTWIGLPDFVRDRKRTEVYDHWLRVFGYDFHYGLHEVDRETFVRTAKPSAGVYSAIVRAHAVAP